MTGTDREEGLGPEVLALRERVEELEQVVEAQRLELSGPPRQRLAYVRELLERAEKAEAALAEAITLPTADFRAYLRRHMDWSIKTFGPTSNNRTLGILAHIRKELAEVEANPTDVTEWVDVMILAIDGAIRNGATSGEIAKALLEKQEKNMARSWPDWRDMPTDAAIEHDRTGEA